MGKTSAIFHTFALVHHLYAIKYSHIDLDYSKTNDPQVLTIKQFSLRYFTSWNISIQTLYFVIALLNDVLQLTDQCKSLRKNLQEWKGYIFTTFVFPCTMFVTVMFWSVYTIDRELVLPAASDEIIPKWLNHSLHTNIAVFLFIEVFVSVQTLPSFKSALFGLSIITIIYDCLFFFTYYESGKWIYGLFYVLKWHERILFMVFNYICSVIAMKLGIMVENFKTKQCSLKDLKLL